MPTSKNDNIRLQPTSMGKIVLPPLGVLHGDCLDLLKEIEDNSLDFIIADPPYFIGFDGNKGWDSLWKSEDEYLEWCKKWTQACWQKLKPGRAMVVWGTLKTDTFLRYKLEVLSKLPLAVARNEIIWENEWGGKTRTDFARKHEYAWVVSKGKNLVFNADSVRIPRKMKTNPRTGLPFTQGKIPTCIWQFNNHTMSTKTNVNWHPTTKNTNVFERLIEAYSNLGETIFDPFMGSGTTAIAAIRRGRGFLGAEQDREYYDRLTERIASEIVKIGA